MPLSEHEQRLLDQLEKQLGADDPTFAQSMNSGSAATGVATTPSYSPRNLAIGALVVLVGLGVVIAGVSTKLIIVGVLGFIIAAAGLYGATTHTDAPTTKATPAKTAGAAKQSRFMQNLEGRWDERRRGQ
ncbi:MULTISPECIES: DUF3040 domain-containing protein [unclassified Rothia (in: high G+C Gram-positive bacteria)]|uniref:DUF3040 domain-containing protein n=1 Tax=unclassified Rothia (in: high G+C Gram-positive bacteria) TaxID=2689056 RepID=UPI00195EB25D|nr:MULTISPECIES: DUF3040 domain-containing protein [unclassified Rothia (in: high G+C Gram-positive bacteria)]MBM7050767.1 DUF3040 domain-containing protein [Rothia sp. ZJ1223]QRZ60944.1 DUF3040 domain-containing protein [Rothia sp. ZJ932]